jgi:hypothetical protein
MLDIEKLLPSRYARAATWTRPAGNFQIAKAVQETMPRTNDLRVVLDLDAPDSPRIVLNRSSLRRCVARFGRNEAEWVGRTVRVETEPVQVSGEPAMSFRVTPVD